MLKTIIASLLIFTGLMSQYDPTVMERSVINNQANGHLPEEVPHTDGFVALADCGEVGRIVFMRPLGNSNWESFLVADCASKTDSQSDTDSRSGYEWMLTEGIIAEVDYQTALRWKTAGKGGFRVEMTKSIPLVLYRQPKLFGLK